MQSWEIIGGDDDKFARSIRKFGASPKELWLLETFCLDPTARNTNTAFRTGPSKIGTLPVQTPWNIHDFANIMEIGVERIRVPHRGNPGNYNTHKRHSDQFLPFWRRPSKGSMCQCVENWQYHGTQMLVFFSFFLEMLAAFLNAVARFMAFVVTWDLGSFARLVVGEPLLFRRQIQG